MSKRREDGYYKEQAETEEVFDQDEMEEAEGDEKGTDYKGNIGKEER